MKALRLFGIILLLTTAVGCFSEKPAWCFIMPKTRSSPTTCWNNSQKDRRRSDAEV